MIFRYEYVNNTPETTETIMNGAQPADTDRPAKTQYELDAIRGDLIDTGAWNNRLVNFKPSQKLGIDLIAAGLDALYATMVDEGKLMQVRSSSKDQALMAAQDGDVEGTGEHKANVLHANLTADPLRTRLSAINRETKSHRQEMGFECLYLALGFLTYYDSDDSDLTKTAPLVMIPVDLLLSPRRTLFSATYNGVEVNPNIALAQRLKHDFDIELPEQPANFRPSQWLDDVERAIETKERWKVDKSRVHLGFFSNALFLMYQDLDPENWLDTPLHEHPVLSELLGSGTEKHGRDAATANNRAPRGDWPPQLTPVVIDADSSQLDAINAAESGRNIVIQGPPGTGKSQTITNIIARKVALGKKVLFVSAKLAALEVVKRRLDAVQLGDATLELHSHKANRKSMLDELDRTLGLGEPHSRDLSWKKKDLIDTETQLREHFEDVHREINRSERNFIQVCSELETLNYPSDRPRLNISISGLADLSEDDWQSEMTRLKKLAEHRALIGNPDRGPLRNLRITSLDRNEFDEAVTHYRDAFATLKDIVDEAAQVARALMVSEPEDFVQLKSLIRFASSTLEGPPPDNICRNGRYSADGSATLRQLVTIGNSQRDARNRTEPQVKDHAWDQNLDGHRSVWMSKGRSIFRWLSKDYRTTRSHLRGIFTMDVVRDFDACAATLDDVIEFQLLGARFRELATGTDAALSPQWRGADSDWNELRQSIEWVRSKASCLENKVGELEAHLRAARLILDTDLYSDHGGSLANDHLPRMAETLQSLSTVKFVDLLKRVEYNELLSKANGSKLRGCVDPIHSGTCSYEQLREEVMRCWLESLRDHASENFPAIRKFNLKAFENDRTRFVERDAESLTWAKASAMNAHYSQVPDRHSLGGQMAIINLMIKKPKSRKPIRELIEETLDAILSIKPIIMMSPMSVAKFLPRSHTLFDVVIFDEASQLRASEAIGAIARSKQVIVVGDDKQLPPTNFFRSGGDDDVDGEYDDADVTGIKSILDLFVGKAFEAFTLRWHYRSRSEDLIDFSNRHFYEHKLVTFPDSGTETLAKGLSLNSDPANLYTPGAAVNHGEARAVAQRVLEHARDYPDSSLGVVAFSVPQRNRILDELESIRKEHPELDDFMSEDRDEPFFVKNLENVQGDERDVIFISIGYGRREDGKIGQNFGPINRDGGERRLNVLVTRAKLSMEVFCNFKASDLIIKAGAKQGLVAFRDFLGYVENPDTIQPKETGMGPESLFEEQVARTVASIGCDFETQVGMSDYRIDIGVRSATEPGRYILGIECDGASYHSSFSARDRDRLRQNHLESMGWRIHRIWSTDWFQSTPSDREERLRQAIEAAQKASEET